jgi:hypothetical protein
MTGNFDLHMLGEVLGHQQLKCPNSLAKLRKRVLLQYKECWGRCIWNVGVWGLEDEKPIRVTATVTY